VLFKSAEGYGFRLTNSVPRQFYSVEATQLSSNALLSYNVLNRLAYGPTPDDIERVLTGPSPTGPQAFIQEQLAPENIVNTWDDYTSVTTNAVNLPPNTNWTTVSVTGQVSSSSIYMYLTRPGEVLLDDVRLQLLSTVIQTNGSVVTTNMVLGPNVLVNGSFESVWPAGWTVSANHATSATTTADGGGRRSEFADDCDRGREYAGIVDLAKHHACVGQWNPLRADIQLPHGPEFGCADDPAFRQRCDRVGQP
jgi:hypothetical protein